jgi:hypothetical protein
MRLAALTLYLSFILAAFALYSRCICLAFVRVPYFRIAFVSHSKAFVTLCLQSFALRLPSVRAAFALNFAFALRLHRIRAASGLHSRCAYSALAQQFPCVRVAFALHSHCVCLALALRLPCIHTVFALHSH